MTTYQGGKKRLGKKIYQVLTVVRDYFDMPQNVPYVEPFVGMASVIREFGKERGKLHPANLFATDINKDLILLHKANQRGWKPPRHISEKQYNELKYSKRHSPLRGFAGIAASWGGNFFHAYRLKYETTNKYLEEAARGLAKLRKDIKNVKFLDAMSYDQLGIEKMKNLLIYCDPPYRGNNLTNSLFRTFDHDKFWNVMREWSKHNVVVISESSAPPDFKVIFNLKSHVTPSSDNALTKYYQENLYMYESLVSKELKKRIKAVVNE